MTKEPSSQVSQLAKEDHLLCVRYFESEKNLERHLRRGPRRERILLRSPKRLFLVACVREPPFSTARGNLKLYSVGGRTAQKRKGGQVLYVCEMRF